MGRIKKIHDGFIKRIFESDKNSRDFLNYVLPADLLTSIDLSKIETDSTNFIDENIKESISDIVIRTKIKSESNDNKVLESDIYILFEHKSNTKGNILFQVLKYMYLMWDKDIQNKKDLRVIIPLIFYNGKAKWKVNANFVDQFNVSDSIKKYLLNYQYVFFDTANFDFNSEENKKIKDNVFLVSSLMLMKGAYNKDIESIMNIFNFWKEKGFVENIENLRFFISYIVETKDVKKEKLIKILEESKIEGGDIMPTLAREWFNEGIEKGMQQGIQQGVLKGRTEGKIEGRTEGRTEGITERNKELAFKMFNENMKIDDISKFTGLSKKEVEKILEN